MNEKIKQVRCHSVLDRLSNDGAAMVPSNESHIVMANENKEYVGPILRAYMRGGIGCNLATGIASFNRCFYKWIGLLEGCSIVRAGHSRLWRFDKERIIITPPFELNEELNSGRISATEIMFFGKYRTIEFNSEGKIDLAMFLRI